VTKVRLAQFEPGCGRCWFPTSMLVSNIGLRSSSRCASSGRGVGGLGRNRFRWSPEGEHRNCNFDFQLRSPRICLSKGSAERAREAGFLFRLMVVLGCGACLARFLGPRLLARCGPSRTAAVMSKSLLITLMPSLFSFVTLRARSVGCRMGCCMSISIRRVVSAAASLSMRCRGCSCRSPSAMRVCDFSAALSDLFCGDGDGRQALDVR
jgi:hypothetical protein